MKRPIILGSAAVASAVAAFGLFFWLKQPTQPSVAVVKLPPVDPAAVTAKAQAGDAQAEVQLARLYIKGEGVTNSYKEAAQWFNRAAAQTNSDALLGLGELYEAGQGVPRDLNHALQLYRQAAELGNPDGQYTLAFMYESGHGLPQSHAEAAKWYQRAAERGQALAQYDLGQRYNLGVGVPVDRVEGLKWLLLAAAQGQTDAAGMCDKVKRELTRDQIAEAQQRVAAFSPRRAVVP